MPNRLATSTICNVGDLGEQRAARRMVHIDIEPHHDQPHGLVDTGDGEWRPFWGWLELMQTIEDAVVTPSPAGPAHD
jgi:hypothetical protein